MSKLPFHSRRSCRRRRCGLRPCGDRSAGFTLIELMISIAIVLVLMLGINYVFSTSAKTISTGMAVTGVTREIRGARKVLETDFRNAVPAEEMPALIIHNETVYAWKDKQDKLADADNDPTTYDVDGNPGDEIDLSPNTDATGLDPSKWSPTTPAPYGNLPGVYNHRRHRVDRISFFARNSSESYLRQTGDADSYINNLTSSEAWIQYGLLRLADNNAIDYWKPGARGDPASGVYPDERGNQNNFFATQWILGRKLMLLADPATFPVDTVFVNGSAANLGVNFGVGTMRSTAGAPAAFNRESPPYPTATPWRIEESRVDLVGVYPFGTAGSGSPIQRLRARMAPPFNVIANWIDADPTTTTPSTNRDKRAYNSPLPTPTLNYLAWAKPFVNKSNFATSIASQTRETALTTPIFLRGVTQFIVEFAGDFYDQGIAGQPEPLGTIDYVPDVATNSAQIRWYGMPRETDGTPGFGPKDTLPLSVPPPAQPSGTNPPPARFTGAGAQLAEKPRTTQTLPYIFAWGPTSGTLPVEATATTPVSTPGDPSYIRPSLIRITMELIDPNGRLEEGQRIELVFRMKTPTFN